MTERVLARIDALDDTLNAFVTVLSEQALHDAREAEREILAGRYRGPLHGVPVSIKDLFATKGIRTTAGSRVLANHVPDHDATVVERLRTAGAIIVGKTNMLEFAYAACTPTTVRRRIPGIWRGHPPDRAVARPWRWPPAWGTAQLVPIPADRSGCRPPTVASSGLKPTYGRVSRHGGIPVSWSADHFGPMTRTAGDAAALLGAIAGEDPRDPTSGRVPVPDYVAELDGGVTGKRIGISDLYLRHHVDPTVRVLVEQAIATLERLGATVEEITLPPPSEAVAALLAILMPEATVYHLPWLREQPESYSSAVRERLELGAVTPAVSYIQGQQVRRRFIDDVPGRHGAGRSARHADRPTAATLLEGDLITGDEADPQVLAALIHFSGPFNLTGFPAVSIPCGFTPSGLPVGMQLVASPGRRVHSWRPRTPTSRRPIGIAVCRRCFNRDDLRPFSTGRREVGVSHDGRR